MSALERRQMLLETLCLRRRDTYRNLAEEFGVSRETIRQDVNALMSDHPIETIRGRYGGGVKVVDGYHLHRPLLNQEQKELLVRLKPLLKGHDLETLNSILKRFAL